jgi:hypothetical protein
MIKTPGGAPGVGGLTFAKADGKGSTRQHLGTGIHAFSPGSTSVAPGDPLSRTMGQYAKGHSYLSGDTSIGGDNTDTDPAKHAGSNMIRGSAGGIRHNTRQGGLGPGQMGGVSGGRLYAKSDTE